MGRSSSEKYGNYTDDLVSSVTSVPDGMVTRKGRRTNTPDPTKPWRRPKLVSAFRRDKAVDCPFETRVRDYPARETLSERGGGRALSE